MINIFLSKLCVLNRHGESPKRMRLGLFLLPRGALDGVVLLGLVYGVDEAVLLSFFGSHEVVAVNVFLNFLKFLS